MEPFRVTIEEAARLLSISIRQLAELVRAGHIPPPHTDPLSDAPNARRFHRIADLERYVNDRARPDAVTQLDQLEHARQMRRHRRVRA